MTGMSQFYSKLGVGTQIYNNNPGPVGTGNNIHGFIWVPVRQFGPMKTSTLGPHSEKHPSESECCHSTGICADSFCILSALFLVPSGDHLDILGHSVALCAVQKVITAQNIIRAELPAAADICHASITQPTCQHIVD